MRGETFLPGSWPPLPGLAPCANFTSHSAARDGRHRRDREARARVLDAAVAVGAADAVLVEAALAGVRDRADPGRDRSPAAPESREAVAVERVHRARDGAVRGLGERALAHPGRHEAPQHVLLGLHLVERDRFRVRHQAQQVEDTERLAIVHRVGVGLVGRLRAGGVLAARRVARGRVQRAHHVGIVAVGTGSRAEAELPGVGELGPGTGLRTPRRGSSATRDRARPGRCRPGDAPRPGTRCAARRGPARRPRSAWRRSRPRRASRPSSTWLRRSRRAGP